MLTYLRQSNPPVVAMEEAPSYHSETLTGRLVVSVISAASTATLGESGPLPGRLESTFSASTIALEGLLISFVESIALSGRLVDCSSVTSAGSATTLEGLLSSFVEPDTLTGRLPAGSSATSATMLAASATTVLGGLLPSSFVEPDSLTGRLANFSSVPSSVDSTCALAGRLPSSLFEPETLTGRLCDVSSVSADASTTALVGRLPSSLAESETLTGRLPVISSTVALTGRLVACSSVASTTALVGRLPSSLVEPDTLTDSATLAERLAGVSSTLPITALVGRLSDFVEAAALTGLLPSDLSSVFSTAESSSIFVSSVALAGLLPSLMESITLAARLSSLADSLALAALSPDPSFTSTALAVEGLSSGTDSLGASSIALSALVSSAKEDSFSSALPVLLVACTIPASSSPASGDLSSSAGTGDTESLSLFSLSSSPAAVAAATAPITAAAPVAAIILPASLPSVLMVPLGSVYGLFPSAITCGYVKLTKGFLAVQEEFPGGKFVVCRGDNGTDKIQLGQLQTYLLTPAAINWREDVYTTSCVDWEIRCDIYMKRVEVPQERNLSPSERKTTDLSGNCVYSLTCSLKGTFAFVAKLQCQEIGFGECTRLEVLHYVAAIPCLCVRLCVRGGSRPPPVRNQYRESCSAGAEEAARMNEKGNRHGEKEFAHEERNIFRQEMSKHTSSCHKFVTRALRLFLNLPPPPSPDFIDLKIISFARVSSQEHNNHQTSVGLVVFSLKVLMVATGNGTESVDSRETLTRDKKLAKSRTLHYDCRTVGRLHYMQEH
ncbi:hypothetical protein C0J52_08421 [Blattella germanica]|nr:hypothetical protein C0J52_08421 [Blattella germanica]